MSSDETRYRCKICGVFKDTRTIAQTHVKHDHHISGYDEINANIEEYDD